MKIIHIESGLGNQMLSYAEYLVMSKNHPKDQCYIETIIYDIPECNHVICQWNGYELQRIFGINAPDIKKMFDAEQWNRIIERVRASEFWRNNWDYPEAIVSAINAEGYQIRNMRGHVQALVIKENFIQRYSRNQMGYFLKRVLRPLYAEKYIKKNSTHDQIFIKTEEDIFSGQYLGLCHKNAGIEFIERELREAFQFPPLEKQCNKKLLIELENCNSVAIHARRGDAASANAYCYKYGFFKRAIKYIKEQVAEPHFYFFSDPGSVSWCKENIQIFGLDMDTDFIRFVDWNTGTDSFRDMQLMACCKHNIITSSSFGWWASFLNENPNKITISPNVWLNTTHTF